MMQVTLTSYTEGASIGYKTDESSEDWLLYTEPFEMPVGTPIFAKAVRYGYAESDVIFGHVD